MCIYDYIDVYGMFIWFIWFINHIVYMVCKSHGFICHMVYILQHIFHSSLQDIFQPDNVSSINSISESHQTGKCGFFVGIFPVEGLAPLGLLEGSQTKFRRGRGPWS